MHIFTALKGETTDSTIQINVTQIKRFQSLSICASELCVGTGRVEIDLLFSCSIIFITFGVLNLCMGSNFYLKRWVGPSLPCFPACALCIFQIHIWCSTCWPLDDQHIYSSALQPLSSPNFSPTQKDHNLITLITFIFKTPSILKNKKRNMYDNILLRKTCYCPIFNKRKAHNLCDNYYI